MPRSLAATVQLGLLLLAALSVTFGGTREARADACAWSYPVGSAPASPAPSKDGHPVGGTNLPQYGLHLGTDFWEGGGCADLGKPVYAAADGVVAEIADALGSYLDVVVLRHDDPEVGTVYTMYGHLARAASLTVGQKVTRRQTIGSIGNVLPYGFSPCHLHFEILSPNAFDEGPFCSGCAAAKIKVSPGYDQKRGMTKGTHPTSGDPYLELNDAIADNRWYLGEPFLARRLARSCGVGADGGPTTSDGGAGSAGEGPGGAPVGHADPDGGAAGDGSPGPSSALDEPDAGSCRAAPVGVASGGVPLLLACAFGASGALRRAARRRRESRR